MLNSGGPTMLVVDHTPDTVVAAWRSGEDVYEMTFPQTCVHRIDPTKDIAR